MKIRAVCVKGNNRIEMIVEYDDIILARNDLHTQGYSVIEIDSIQDDSIIGNNEDFFYFDIQFQNATRSGKIQAKDILTAYKRLVEEMGYTVISIYASKNATLEEKIYTTNAVKSSYEVFLHSKKTEEKVIQERKNTSEIHQNDVLSREITRYQALIDRTIQKIQKIFITYNSILTEDKKLKLQEIATVLTRIKQITNVEKLKQIGEISLEKIGNLELELSQNLSSEKRKELVSETQKLLKDFGSNKKIEYQIKKGPTVEDFFKDIVGLFFESQKPLTELSAKESSDRFLYYKNVRELHIYEEKLKTLHLRQLLVFFRRGEYRRMQMKIRLLKQNIAISQARIKKTPFSYSKIIKGLAYYQSSFLRTLQVFGDFLLAGIFIGLIFYVLRLDVEKLESLSPLGFIISCSVLWAIYSIRSFSSFLFVVPVTTFFIFFLILNFG